jgi:hypothetical protein
MSLRVSKCPSPFELVDDIPRTILVLSGQKLNTTILEYSSRSCVVGVSVSSSSIMRSGGGVSPDRNKRRAGAGVAVATTKWRGPDVSSRVPSGPLRSLAFWRG